MYELDDLELVALEHGITLDPMELEDAQLGDLTGPGPGGYDVWIPGAGDPPPPTSPEATWTKTQGDIPPEDTPGSGWPGAVPIRPANWNLDTEPDSYKIAWGDTYAGLSSTYLGTPMRWREIWDQQPDTYRWNRSPDRIMPGEWIFMPPDASATLRAALGHPPEPGDKPAPAPPGGYPTPVGPTPPGMEPEAKKKSKLPYIAAAVGIGALGLYALS